MARLVGRCWMGAVLCKRGIHALRGPVAAMAEALIALLDAPAEDLEPVPQEIGAQAEARQTGLRGARQSESACATIKTREREIEVPFSAASRSNRVLWTKPL